MSELDLEALKALALAACEGDDPAEVGCWVRRGEVEHRLRAARGETFSLSYHRVEPEWSDGDVEILCEVDVHADYIAAMGPITTLALIAEIERLRQIVRSHDYFMFGNKGFRLDGPYVRTDPNATASPPSMPSSWEAGE